MDILVCHFSSYEVACHEVILWVNRVPGLAKQGTNPGSVGLQMTSNSHQVISFSEIIYFLCLLKLWKDSIKRWNCWIIFASCPITIFFAWLCHYSPSKRFSWNLSFVWPLEAVPILSKFVQVTVVYILKYMTKITTFKGFTLCWKVLYT